MNTSGNPAAADFSAGRSLVGPCVEPSSPGQTDRLSACTRPITAVIITLNGATHLGRVLESVGLCSERLVLDSGSTDGTVALACAAAVLAITQGAPGWAAIFVWELANPPLWLLAVFGAAAFSAHLLHRKLTSAPRRRAASGL